MCVCSVCSERQQCTTGADRCVQPALVTQQKKESPLCKFDPSPSLPMGMGPLGRKTSIVSTCDVSRKICDIRCRMGTLQNAIDTVSQATKLDGEGNAAEAIKLYMSGIALLKQALQGTQDNLPNSHMNFRGAEYPKQSSDTEQNERI